MLFTSESVTEGHPDKLCDYISDSILDEYLKQDNMSRVAVETLVSKKEIYVTGEVTSNAVVDIPKVVRNAVRKIGYDKEEKGLNYETCKIYVNISKQSKDIAQGVDILGAGDQGIMFGYACDETPEYMPQIVVLAHKLAKRLTQVRKQNILSYLRPDGKTQITGEFDEAGTLKRIDTIVVSAQHSEEVELDVLRQDITKEVINVVIPSNLLDKKTKIYINPTGRFVIGGPAADSGLTGRKIIVDTYGSFARHGGGAFSGKDPTKVDRSAAYMARHISKAVVQNGYAKKCELQLGYVIGVTEPISVYINTYGTNTIPENEIIKKIRDKFDLTPNGIINYLDLRQPIYTKTTNYGHFGKEEMSYEKNITF